MLASRASAFQRAQLRWRGLSRQRRTARRVREAQFCASLLILIRASTATSAKRNFPVRSFLPRSCTAAPSRRLRCRPLTAALEERPFDMVQCNEIANRLGDDSWHRHGSDQIIASIRKSLALCRIGSHGKKLIAMPRYVRTQDHPQYGCTRRKVAAVIRRFRPVQLDDGFARIE